MANETTTAQGTSPHPTPPVPLQPTALPSPPIPPKSLSFDLDRLSPLVEDISSFPRIHAGVTVTGVDNTKPVEGIASQITETKPNMKSDDPFAGQKVDVVNPFSTNGAKTGDLPDEWGMFSISCPALLPFRLVSSLVFPLGFKRAVDVCVVVWLGEVG